MPVKLVKKILVLALVFGAIALPMVSRAQGAGGTAGSVVSCGLGEPGQCLKEALAWFLEIVVSLIQTLSGALISIAGAFINVLVKAAGEIISNPLVKAGFSMTLSLANLGFVLAIIVIAFVTILRLQNYQLKQLMFNLVVAALLINFSFAIAGVIIDFNNVLGNFFLNSVGDVGKISDNIANTLKIQALTNVAPKLENIRNAGFVNEIFKILLPAIAVVIFNVLLVITFFALAVMLLIRYLYLLILLIFMPLAWLFSIFPNLSHLTGKWWDKFLHWNFFYPAVSFFIYLTVITSDKMGEIIKGGAEKVAVAGPAAGAATILGVESTVITTLLTILVQSGMIFGGLMAAQAMGIASTSAVMNAAKGTARFALGTTKLAGRSVGAVGGALGGTRAIKASTGWLANKLASNKFIQNWVPGATRATAGLAAFSSRKKEVEEAQKKYDNLTEDQAKNVAKTTPYGPVDKAGMLASLAKRKKIEWLTAGIKEGDEEGKKARLKEFSQAAIATDNSGLTKDITKTHPSYAPYLTDKTVKEAMGGSRGSEIDKSELKKDEVAENITHPQISDIAREGIPEKIENLEKVFLKIADIEKETFEEIQKKEGKITDVLRKITELKQQGADRKEVKDSIKIEQASLVKLRNELRGIYTPTDPNPEKAEKKRRAYENLQTLNQKPRPGYEFKYGQ